MNKMVPLSLSSSKTLRLSEFLILFAAMTSLIALSIDAMLPALYQIGTDLAVDHVNQTQLIISMFILGMTLGELVLGPFSDTYGRKKTILLGLGIYCLGALFTMFAESFPQMLAGRIIQGIGASGPKVASRALIRDLYAGRAMARILSFIMAIFILTPMLAPACGQLIMELYGWRSIFLLFLLHAGITAIWFGCRQPETLAIKDRLSFSPLSILKTSVLIIKHPKIMAYTIMAGLILGIQLVYLSTSQAMFHDFYQAGARFPLYFGILAAGIGLASIINGQLVIRLGLFRLVLWSLISLQIFSSLLLISGLFQNGIPDFYWFMTLCFLIFFCMGFLFGNINAMAMEYVGRVAGLGASITGSFSSLVAVVTAISIGYFYNGTVLPLAIGLICTASLAIILVIGVQRTAASEI